MSAKATFWAWEQALKSAPKLVLLCLADCHNDDNGQCNPSVAFIAKKTGLDKKTVPLAAEKLKNIGLISWRDRAGQSRNYTLNLTQNWVGWQGQNKGSTLPENGYTQKRVYPKTGMPKNGEAPYPKTGSAPYPKTGTKPISEPKKNLKVKYRGIYLDRLPKEISPDVAKELIAHRAALKKPLSQSSFERLIKKSLKPNNLGLGPNEVITQCIDHGWAGIEPAWLENKQTGGHHASHRPGKPAKQTPAQRVAAQAEKLRASISSPGEDGQFLGVDDTAIPPQVVEHRG